MTIALLPRRADAIGRFARFSFALRGAAAHRTLPHPLATPVINEGRWVALPGDASELRARPLNRTLPAITAPGVSGPIACAGFGPVTVHLAGTWVGRVAFEGSMDGVRWSPLSLAALDGGMEAATTDRPSLWRTLPTQSVAFIRLRVIHLAGGTLLSAIAATAAMHHAAHEALDPAA